MFVQEGKTLAIPLQEPGNRTGRRKTQEEFQNFIVKLMDLKELMHKSQGKTEWNSACFLFVCFLLPLSCPHGFPVGASLHLKAQGAIEVSLWHASFTYSLEKETLTCFIPKAALLSVEYSLRLKFGDESLMDETKACMVPNYCCSV